MRKLGKRVELMNPESEVVIIHAVDTEGPLFESLNAKFERLNELFGINDIDPTWENLDKLQKSELDLGGIESKVRNVLSGHLLDYNDSYEKIDEMLTLLMSDDFRYKMPDSYGGGWKFTWHCLDHVGYDYNPRRRDIGYHNVFDHYRAWLKRFPEYGDNIQWHFHPMSTYSEAHRCATSYFRNDLVFQVLCRKIIERNWFPSAFRAGFQAERPDCHWFLEQWIPFDITNMAMEGSVDFEATVDFRLGRSGDWRRAPSDWSIYHPHHDDYQQPGQCRRWIGRALNVMNRIANINLDETKKAFEKASVEKSRVLLGVTGHDFRNLVTEVNYVRDLINQASNSYPNVKFRYTTVKEGFQRVIWGDRVDAEPLHLQIDLLERPKGDVPHIIIKTTQGKVFGPQPFLAIQTKSRRFFHDNLDMISNGCWGYAFHSDTLPIADVERLAVAANDKYGNTVIEKILVNNTE